MPDYRHYGTEKGHMKVFEDLNQRKLTAKNDSILKSKSWIKSSFLLFF